MMLLFTAGIAAAQVDAVEFASEYALASASPAVLQTDGIVAEVQTHWMEAFRSPTGLVVVPVVPRMALGVADQAQHVRWTTVAHGFAVLPGDGHDAGGGAGVAGGFALGVPNGRIRVGFDFDAQWLGFRTFDDRYTRMSLGAGLVSGYDVGPTTILFRIGPVWARTRSDTVRLGIRTTTVFQPRTSLGLAVRPGARWTLAAIVRSGVRQLIPRVPINLTLAATYQIRRFDRTDG